MKLTVQFQRPINIGLLLRAMGYHNILDRHTSKESWVRNLGRGHYPRFHLYISTKTAGILIFDLHIDQKKSSIELPGVKRHAGEYDSPVVEEEMGRIQRWAEYAKAGGRL